MNIVLIGAPGSGKSTQGKIIAKTCKVPYMSMGQVLRNTVKEGKIQETEHIKKVMESGNLLSEHIIAKVLSQVLTREEYKNGFVIDGFPRTIDQVKLLPISVDLVIYINISDKEALWRLAHRTDEREDDTLQTIIKRIAIFHEETSPLIAHFEMEGKLIRINGEQSIDIVGKNIVEALYQRGVTHREG